MPVIKYGSGKRHGQLPIQGSAMAGLMTLLTNGLRKARVERDLVRHSFPEFVSHNRVGDTRGTIPVFCFHSVKAVEFESLLKHLHRNNYVTLDAQGLVEQLQGRQPPARSVALTFDDGWRSTWTIAHPLLKKYGQRAISFLVPTWMNDTPVSPTLEDCWNGRLSLEDVHTFETEQPYLSWSEARRMQASGVFEFQSHSLTHDTVFTSSEIVDFVNPAFQRVPHKIPLVGDVPLDPWQRASHLGMPLYTVAPRLTGATRCITDAAVRERCVEFVKERGNERFFDAADWRGKLKQVAEAAESSASESVSEATRDLEIRHELKESKRLIEEQLGNEVRHFCFPFYAGSELVSEISAELGYASNHWGWMPTPRNDVHTKRYGKRHLYDALDETDYSTGNTLLGRRINRIGDDPMRIVRVPGDYVHRLPGAGRRSMTSMFVRKCLRNFRK